jgi:hypothetical protein
MWAEALLQFDFRLTDYWLPLAIGLAVGALCIVWGRRLLPGRQKEPGLRKPKAKSFFDVFAQGSPSNLRKAARRGGNLVEVLYARPEGRGNPLKGWVMDRSVSGLCLWLGEDFPEGTILSVLPVSASSVTPWTDVEVCNCRPGQEGFEIGCKFVKSPPSLILMQFG